jgi:hypothetical protein
MPEDDSARRPGVVTGGVTPPRVHRAHGVYPRGDAAGVGVGCLALLLASGASGQPSQSDQPAQVEVDYEVPAEELGDLTADGGLDLGELSFTGNPARSLFSWWPADLVLAPIPGYSPQLEGNLALGAAYFLDEQVEGGPPPSVLGALGFVSGNGSYAYAAGAKFHLLDDRVRVRALGGYLDVRYRFYGVGNAENGLGISLDIQQQAPMAYADASYRIWKRLYLGAGFLAGEVRTRPRFTNDVSNFRDPITYDLNLAAVTIPLSWDSRDHEQFPRKGWLAEGKATLYREQLGSGFSTDVYQIAVNRYLPVRTADVIAMRAFFSATSDDAPFFILSSFGGQKDLRGYPAGRYRDRMMYAVQGEYRWHLRERWIVTGFAGVGEVARTIGDFGANLLPATGVGLRYVLSAKHRLSLSADVAVGKDGAEFYFGVGEAF